MKKMNYVFSLLTLLFVGLNINAQTRYVSVTGSDASNNCELPGSPCATVAHAVSVATTDDSIRIAPGQYTFGSVLNVNLSGLVITAMDPTNKPEIIAGAPDVMSVTAPNVTISNLVFKMGLLLNGKRGIVATGNFDNIKIRDNEFITTTLNGIWAPNGVVFSSYAILLNASPSTPCLATVRDNYIGPLTPDYANFGRGIGLGLNSGNSATPHGTFTGNEIYAYYPVQALLCKGDLTFEDNDFSGICMFNAPSTSATVLVNNNTFNAVSDNISSYLYAVLDVRAFGIGELIISNNEFLNYSNIGMLSMASKGVQVLNNTFTPSPTAGDFVSILANTKLMTAGTQNNTYSDEITILGNTFNAGAPNGGTALMFGDHYGENTPAFAVTVVGGPAQNERNSFAAAHERFIVLDSLEGSSNAVPLWTLPTATPETIMKPITQDVQAWLLHNYYGGLPTETAIEAKNIDKLDLAILGKVILGDLSSIGIEEMSAGNFKIYPNPSAGELNIAIKEFEASIELSIVDLAGRTLVNKTINPTGNDYNFAVDCAHLPEGNYILKLTTSHGTFLEKFIKL